MTTVALDSANPHSIYIEKIVLFPYQFQFDAVRTLASNAASSSNSPSYPGFDITNIIVEFNIYESMHEPFMKGEILVMDSLSLMTTLPIVGEEILEIAFYVPHPKLNKKQFKKKFRITGMKDMKLEKNRVTSYRLEFVSEEMIFNTARKIRKSYRNMPISQMVKEIYETYLQSKLDKVPIEVQDSNPPRTIIIPNMNPARAIKFLAYDAENATEKPSNYVFFQNREKFQFRTIEEIILKSSTQREVPEYSLREFNIMSDRALNGANTGPVQASESDPVLSTQTTNPLPLEWSKVSTYRINHAFDKLQELAEGLYENKAYLLDIDKQQFREKTLTHKEGFNQIKKIGRRSFGQGAGSKTITENSYWENLNDPKGQFEQLITRIQDGENHIGDAMLNYIIFKENRTDPTENTQRQNFINLYTFSMAGLNNISVVLNVPGQLHTKPGDLIYIRFPEFGGTDDIIKEKHDLIADSYLVVSVRHLYNKVSGYSLSLECVKNVYEQKIETTRHNR